MDESSPKEACSDDAKHSMADLERRERRSMLSTRERLCLVEKTGTKLPVTAGQKYTVCVASSRQRRTGERHSDNLDVAPLVSDHEFYGCSL